MTETSKQATYLTEILEKRRYRIEKDFANISIKDLRANAFESRKNAAPNHLQKALAKSEKINIIAEFKRRSPSKGVINEDANPEQIARLYLENGAAAISVLTEPYFFGGSFADLKTVVETVGDKIPVLCKDFIVDERQIYQASIAGASAILLIVAAFFPNDVDILKDLSLAADKLGLDVLTEVHTLEEMRVAKALGAKIVGVNNRNLQTFQVSLETSVELIKSAAKDAILISESGLQTRDDILRLQSLGYKGFLIGETLMSAEDTGKELRNLAADFQR